jgi:hypothetical protein
MTNLIGTILNGTIAGEEATFKIIRTHKDLDGQISVIADCVEFGAPHQKIMLTDIALPVRA